VSATPSQTRRHVDQRHPYAYRARAHALQRPPATVAARSLAARIGEDRSADRRAWMGEPHRSSPRPAWCCGPRLV